MVDVTFVPTGTPLVYCRRLTRNGADWYLPGDHPTVLFVLKLFFFELRCGLVDRKPMTLGTLTISGSGCTNAVIIVPGTTRSSGCGF
jgi:hypothetical protein